MEPPERQAAGYARRMQELADASERLISDTVFQAVVADPSVRTDAITSQRIQAALERMREGLMAIWRGQRARAAASAQYSRVSGWSGRNVARSLGLDPTELPRVSLDDIWLDRQRQLLDGVRLEYERKIQGALDDIAPGIDVSDVASRFQQAVRFGPARAKLIAVDSTLSLAGELNQVRQKSLGLEMYMWSTSLDERVRSHHASLHGSVHRWDDPPVGGGTRPGERGHPTTGIRCRCVAIPVMK